MGTDKASAVAFGGGLGSTDELQNNAAFVFQVKWCAFGVGINEVDELDRQHEANLFRDDERT